MIGRDNSLDGTPYSYTRVDPTVEERLLVREVTITMEDGTVVTLDGRQFVIDATASTTRKREGGGVHNSPLTRWERSTWKVVLSFEATEGNIAQTAPLTGYPDADD